MVDLVKLRKKAKEKRLEESPSAPQEAVPPAPLSAQERSNAARRGARRGAAPPSESSPGPVEGAALVVAPEAAPAPPAPAPERDDRVQLRGGSERLERFRQTAGELAVDERIAGTAAVPESEQMELLTFSLGAEQYAVSIESIVEIIPPRTPTRVPNADPAIVGVISLRGTMVTVLDVRRRLGHADHPAGDPRIIVVERSGETVGFLVDRVSRVIKVDPLEIGGHPVVAAGEQSQYIRGVIQQAKSIFILLDLEKLIQA